MTQQILTIEDFFEQHPDVAIAFSGGVDSAYLLYLATQHARRVEAFYVASAFQPEFERQEAIEIARKLQVKLTILPVDVLANDTVIQNPANRCYYCKQVIFKTIFDAATKAGFTCLLDGTNASDDATDRPGMKALQELGVYSPLRLCGLSKSAIRQASKAAGLPTWQKPAYACLATRIPTHQTITAHALSCIEQAESFLFQLGFADFRVRLKGEIAFIQVIAEDWPKLAQYRKEIQQAFQPLFSAIAVDLILREPSICPNN